MAKPSNYTENQLLFCLQEAAGYRNLVVDGIPPGLTDHLLGLAAFWDHQADQLVAGSANPATSSANANMSLFETLASLSQAAEEQVPGGVAGFTLVDPTGMFFSEAIFPSLPDFFQNSIPSIPVSEPYTGTCVAAVCTGTVVTCENIRLDDRFNPKWRDVCLRSGIVSVQSQPISLGAGPYAGTFAVGFKEVGSDKHWNANVMKKFADLAASAIRKHRSG
jgi:hypothetical protein